MSFEQFQERHCIQKFPKIFIQMFFCILLLHESFLRVVVFVIIVYSHSRKILDYHFSVD
jgi:hypothetical protein